MGPMYPLARELDEAADRLNSLVDRIKDDRPAFRDHGEEIDAALDGTCGCPNGWKHQPDCPHVTGTPRLRMAEPLDETEGGTR